MLTSGTVVGIVLLVLGPILATFAVIGITIYLRRNRDTPWYSGENNRANGWGFAALLCSAVGIPAIVIPLIGFSLPGWNPEYMAFHEKSGTVQQIEKRLISSGSKSMEERFVVTIDGQPYGIDDTRAALLKPGDTVRLNCTREYVWGSTDNGWACNWGGKS